MIRCPQSARVDGNGGRRIKNSTAMIPTTRPKRRVSNVIGWV